MNFYTVYGLAEKVQKEWNMACEEEENAILCKDEICAKHWHVKIQKLEHTLEVLEDLALEDITNWFSDLRKGIVKDGELPF